MACFNIIRTQMIPWIPKTISLLLFYGFATQTMSASTGVEEFKQTFGTYTLWKQGMVIMVSHTKQRNFPAFVFPSGFSHSGLTNFRLLLGGQCFSLMKMPQF